MFEILVKGVKHQLIANNWKDLRVYLYWKKPDRYAKREELGFLSVEDEEEDELELRGVPDEIATFIEENRELILEHAVY